MAARTRIWDRPEGYGEISRLLHWGMAAMFAWQFTGALLHVGAEDTGVAGFFWSTHASVGFTLWLLVLLRGAWGLANLRRRPSAGSPALAAAARAGHLALYALMIAVPTLAILRAVGGTRGLTVYGAQIAAPRETAITALTAPGNALHGLLGWALLALILGHVAMALFHRFVLRDPTLARMASGPSPRRA